MRVSLLFVAGCICALLAVAPPPAAAQAPQASADPVEAEIARCFATREIDPAAALRLADGLLGSGDLSADQEIKLQACVGRAAALSGNVTRALASVDRIDALLAEEPRPPEFLLRAWSNAGATLHIVGLIHRALDYYARAYEAARSGDLERAQVAMLDNVAEIHSVELGAYDQAETFYARSRVLQDRLAVADPLLPYNRGLNFVRMGRIEDARKAFARAVAEAREVDQGLVELRARAEQLALRPGPPLQPDQVEELESISKEQLALHDPSGAAMTLLRLSRLALEADDAEAALGYARESAALVDGPAFPADQRDALLATLAAQRALGQWQQALETSEAARRMQVVRLQDQNIESLAGLQARLQDAQSERELARMREEQGARDLALRQSRWLRNAAIAALAVLSLLALAFMLYHRRTTRRLHLLGTVDTLTGLLNRGAAAERLARLRRPGGDPARRSVVMLMDVDNFKAHNDSLGHAAGDAILAAIARRIRACCHPDDVMARWGGEEFLVAVRDTDLDGAQALAERLRAEVSAVVIHEAGSEGVTSPTMSIGFASLPFLPDTQWEEGWQASIRLADRALYAAKHAGRDAWVGLWGRGGQAAALEDLLADPAAHAARGFIDVVSSRLPVAFTPAPAPPH